MDNTQYSAYDIKRICERKLKISFGKGGKEQNGWFMLDGIKIARITIPKGRKFIPQGTYSSMAKQLKLTVSEFDNMLVCTMSYAEYISIIQGH